MTGIEKMEQEQAKLAVEKLHGQLKALEDEIAPKLAVINQLKAQLYPVYVWQMGQQQANYLHPGSVQVLERNDWH